MAISHIETTLPAGNPTTSFTVTISASTLTNDLLFLTVIHKATTNPTVTDNDTGGNTWVLLEAINDGTRSYTVWWKRATSGTASKTVTVGSLTG